MASRPKNRIVTARRFLSVGVLVTAAVGWLAMLWLHRAGHIHSGPHFQARFCGPGGLATSGALLWLSGWAVMVIAMMLPPALPLFKAVERLGLQRIDGRALVLASAAGFLMVWLTTGIALWVAGTHVARAISFVPDAPSYSPHNQWRGGDPCGPLSIHPTQKSMPDGVSQSRWHRDDALAGARVHCRSHPHRPAFRRNLRGLLLGVDAVDSSGRCARHAAHAGCIAVHAGGTVAAVGARNGASAGCLCVRPWAFDPDRNFVPRLSVYLDR